MTVKWVQGKDLRATGQSPCWFRVVDGEPDAMWYGTALPENTLLEHVEVQRVMQENFQTLERHNPPGWARKAAGLDEQETKEREMTEGKWVKAPTDKTCLINPEYSLWVENGEPVGIWYHGASPVPSNCPEDQRTNFKTFESQSDRGIGYGRKVLGLDKPNLKELALPGLALASVILTGVVKRFRERSAEAKKRQEQAQKVVAK